MTTTTVPVPAAASRNAKPYLFGTELDAVAAVFDDGEFGHSHITEDFEAAVAAHLGVPRIVSTACGTDALHLALRAAGVGPGDEVVVPSMTFCASVQAILMAGAVPRFADVDPGTLCVTADSVTEALTPATRAVIPVLYGGRAVDLAGVAPVLADRGIVVVEDAAQAFGSMAGDRPVGATGVLTCFSFGPIKSLTCGQGGAVVPRTDTEADTVAQLRLLGMRQSQAERKAATTYSVGAYGIRSPLSAINAAIGLAQLARFDELAAARKRLWRAYANALCGLEQVRLVDVDVERTVPFNCVVRIPDRDAVFAAMRAAGVGVGVHYPPNHLQPAFAAWRRPLPVTEQVAREILSLPFHPAMANSDASAVVAVLRQALDTAVRGRP